MNLKEFTITELEEEVSRRKANQEKQNGLDLLRTKASFNAEEKIEVFDNFYDFLFNGMKEATEIGHFSKDFDHYVYEQGLISFLGKDVFKLVNKYIV